MLKEQIGQILSSPIHTETGIILRPRSAAVVKGVFPAEKGGKPRYQEIEAGEIPDTPLVVAQIEGLATAVTHRAMRGEFDGLSHLKIIPYGYIPLEIVVVDEESPYFKEVVDGLMSPDDIWNDFTKQLRAHLEQGGDVDGLHNIIRDFYFPPTSFRSKITERRVRGNSAHGLQKVEHWLRMLNSPYYLIARTLPDDEIPRGYSKRPFTGDPSAASLKIVSFEELNEIRGSDPAWTYQKNHKALANCGIEFRRTDRWNPFWEGTI